MTVTLKVVLCQRFGEYVSNLVFCVDREYLDKSLAYMFAKVMIAIVVRSDRGCIDKNLRTNISSKIKFEVWKL